MATTKVAAVHAAPVFMDTEATIDKVVAYIKEAGAADIALLVFPETFVPGYPYWLNLYTLLDQSPANLAYTTAAVEVPGPQIARVQVAAKSAGVAVVLGICERLSGTRTCFNSQVFIDADGTLLGVHRKLQPTFGERTVWAQGGGATLEVYDTSVGRLGGLICWEHTMSPVRHVMAQMGEQIHAAAWPGLGSFGISSWDSAEGANEEASTESGPCVVDQQAEVMVRAHAVATQSFVVSAGNNVDETTLTWLEETLGPQKPLGVGGGQSMVISPFGYFVAGPLRGGEDTLLIADIDLAEVDLMKVSVESAGHYARPEIFKVYVDRSPLWHDEVVKSFPLTAEFGE